MGPQEGCAVSATMKSLAAGIFAAATLSACAQVQSPVVATPSALSSGVPVVQRTASGQTSKIQFGQASGIPNGYYELCVAHPNLCRVRAGRIAVTADGSIALTSDAMGQLKTVNASVNAEISPSYRDAWTPGEPVGDCKDYAMTKRQRLINSGWPTSALPTAIVRTARGEEHLVLVARTSQGDFVLDNLTDQIAPWTSTSYAWEKIQSPTDGLMWRGVGL
jgi:predicted transglutaminase-like cysteine proteinase